MFCFLWNFCFGLMNHRQYNSKELEKKKKKKSQQSIKKTVNNQPAIRTQRWKTVTQVQVIGILVQQLLDATGWWLSKTSYLQGKSIGFVGAQISRAVQTIPDKTGGSRENSEQCRIMGELQDYD